MSDVSFCTFQASTVFGRLRTRGEWKVWYLFSSTGHSLGTDRQHSRSTMRNSVDGASVLRPRSPHQQVQRLPHAPDMLQECRSNMISGTVRTELPFTARIRLQQKTCDGCVKLRKDCSSSTSTELEKNSNPSFSNSLATSAPFPGGSALAFWTFQGLMERQRTVGAEVWQTTTTWAAN